MADAWWTKGTTPAPEADNAPWWTKGATAAEAPRARPVVNPALDTTRPTEEAMTPLEAVGGALKGLATPAEGGWGKMWSEGMAGDIYHWVKSGFKSKPPLAGLEHLDKGVLHRLAEFAGDDPEAFGRMFTRGLLQDPELLLGGPVAGTMAKAAGATEGTVKVARAAGAAALGAGESAASQKYREGHVSGKETALAALLSTPGASASGAIEKGLAKGAKGLAKAFAEPKGEPAVAQMTPEERAKAIQQGADEHILAQDPREHPTYVDDHTDQIINEAQSAPRGAASQEAKKALKDLKKPKTQLTDEEVRAFAQRVREQHPGATDAEITQAVKQHQDNLAQTEAARAEQVAKREKYLADRRDAARRIAGRDARTERIAKLVQQPRLPAPKMVDVGGDLTTEAHAPELKAEQERAALEEKYRDQPGERLGEHEGIQVPEEAVPRETPDWTKDYFPEEGTRNKGDERVPEQDVPGAGPLDAESMSRDIKAYAKSQRGEIDPKLAKQLGLTAAGAAAGLYFDKDHPERGAVLGAVLGLGVATPAVLRDAARVAGKAYRTGMAPVNAALEQVAKVHGKLGEAVTAAEKVAGKTPVRAAVLGAKVGTLSWFMGWEPFGGKDMDPTTRQAISAVANAAIAGTLRYVGGKVGLDVARTAYKDVDSLVMDHAANTNVSAMQSATIAAAARKMAGDDVINGTVLKALEWPAERVKTLSPGTQEVVKAMRRYYDETGREAVRQGVFKAMRDNYAPHIFDLTDTKTKEFFDAMDVSKAKVGETRFAKHRKLPDNVTIEQLLDPKYGLKLKTRNANEVLLAYNRAMTQAIEDKRLIQGMEQIKPEGRAPYVLPVKTSGVAPEGYVKFNDIAGLEGHPYMYGKAVDAELVPSLKMVLKGAYKPSMVGAAYNNVTSMLKAIGVSGSFFHARSLLEAAVASGQDPFSSMAGLNKTVERLATDALPNSARAGLKFTPGTTEDFTSAGFAQKFYEKADQLGLKPATALGKAYRKLSDWQEHFTFGVMQNGLKLQTFEQVNGRLLQGLADRGVDITPEVRQAMERQSAAYANTIYGGINWAQEAVETESQLGFKVQAWMASPQGQRAMRRVAFAPDWLYASLNVAAHATGLKAGAPELQQMYREAFYRNLLLTYATKKALESVWGTSDDNAKHPSLNHVQMPDGRHMQIFKHGGEAVHLAEDPLGFMLSKESPLLSDISTLTVDKAKGKPAYAISQDVASRALPFWAASQVEGGDSGATVSWDNFINSTLDILANVAGAQAYGKKDNQ